MYSQVLIMFLIVSVLICAIGISGLVVVFMVTMRTANKISRDITSNMSHKIERKILADIDSGKFFY